MTNRVPVDQIERIVGATRHRTDHIGRAVSETQTIYILHSHECRDSTPDLRECPFSLALDRGIDAAEWDLDTPVALTIVNGRLSPWPLAMPRITCACTADLRADTRPAPSVLDPWVDAHAAHDPTLRDRVEGTWR